MTTIRYRPDTWSKTIRTLEIDERPRCVFCDRHGHTQDECKAKARSVARSTAEAVFAAEIGQRRIDGIEVVILKRKRVKR